MSLPGSYSEKITHLGRSLLGFTRLKHLDLSRNAIESLEGLQDLSHLETLNLYYNNIPSLNEVFKLGHNTKLKDLDLRLNPVTKNEPDYRLFVVHMLVNLRKLDDRGVRDSERKAALMHFDTSQANEFDEHFRPQQLPKPEDREQQQLRHVSARTALVRSLAPRPTALDEDTDYLLDLIAKNDQLLSPSHHRYLAPSESSPGYQRQHLAPPPLHTSHIPVTQSEESSPGHRYQRQPHHKQHAAAHVTPSRLHHQQQQQQLKLHRTQKVPSQHFSGSDNDGGGGYMCYTDQSKPGFAARGGSEEGVSRSSHQLALRQLLALVQEQVEGDLMVLEHDSNFREKFTSWYGSLASRPPAAERSPGRSTGQVESLQGEVEALQSELRAVEGHLRERDRGCEAKDSQVREMEDLLNLVKAESAELNKQLHAQVARTEELSQTHLTLQDSQERLQQATLNSSQLQQKMQALQEENKSLRDALRHSPSASLLEKAHKQIGELQAENCALKREMDTNLDRHKQDLVNTAQLQELATMLQEGHRSLVATNDHLLQELDEAKQRHGQEVSLMNANYEQLRKTVQLYS